MTARARVSQEQFSTDGWSEGWVVAAFIINSNLIPTV